MTDPLSEPERRSRRGTRWLLAAVVVTALVGATAISLQAAEDGDAPPARSGSGEQAPTFRLPDLREPEQKIELADFRGRPVVLNFWASWCVPCRREMPAFQTMHERLGDRVAFVGVNHQDSRGDALALLKQTGVEYPSGHDPEGRVARAYGLFGMPTTVFISAEGSIVATRTGELSPDELADSVAELLSTDG